MHRSIECLAQPGACELVNKREKCATAKEKRLRSTRKILKESFYQHRRIARDEGLYAVAMTLTYRSQLDFDSRNISNHIDKIRKWLKRKGFSLRYSWVLERKETLLHYHLMIWLPRSLAKECSDLVKGWPYGSTWVAQFINPFAWMKYMGKSSTKEALPRSAKSYGCGGFDATGKAAITRIRLPFWLLSQLPFMASMKKVARVGWCNLLTGEVFKSPWVWSGRGWERACEENQARAGDASCLELTVI